jgi:hypothetical protein
LQHLFVQKHVQYKKLMMKFLYPALQVAWLSHIIKPIDKKDASAAALRIKLDLRLKVGSLPMVLRGKPARAGVVGAEMHAARCNSTRSSNSSMFNDNPGRRVTSESR